MFVNFAYDTNTEKSVLMNFPLFSLKVHVQGMRTGNYGMLAVDDFQFINCNYPTNRSCNPTQNQFVCASTACVPMASVCDYTDDCGDGSDEASCGKWLL